jgi:hypothetical protein
MLRKSWIERPEKTEHLKDLGMDRGITLKLLLMGCKAVGWI